MNLLIVLNPVSGDTDKRAFLEQAGTYCTYYGIDYQVFRTQGEGDKERLRERLRDLKPDRLLAVGGDGTFLLVAEAALGSDIPIGVIPMGSANGMARELGVAENPSDALRDFIASRYIARLDLLEVNERFHCLHLGDVGANARLVQAYEQDENRGMVTYARYFIEELRNMEQFTFRLETAETSFQGHAVMLGLCNGRKFGTGIPTNLVGNPFDGKMELVIVEEVDYMKLIRAGLSVLHEHFLDNHISQVISTTSAQISFDKPRLLQLDGEVIGTFEQLSVRVKPQAVPLVTHGGNPYL